MPCRRRSAPLSVLCIWDAVDHIISQNRQPHHDAVVQHLITTSGYARHEWEKDIKEIIADKLIEFTLEPNTSRCIYQLPTGPVPLSDGRDWYCFQCHGSGSVEHCKNKLCSRVFHTQCARTSALDQYTLFKNYFTNSGSTVLLKTASPTKQKALCFDTDGLELIESSESTVTGNKSSYDLHLCLVCNMAFLDKLSFKRSEVNHYLNFVLRRIKSWIPSDITDTIQVGKVGRKSLRNNNLALKSHYLLFEKEDMSLIRQKIKQESYDKLYIFLADVLTIKHNIGIFHGVHSQEYGAAEFIVRDALHDIGEIIGCSDCYRNSNEKINNDWFSIPCRVPHEIVWAKQRGYCYWPAKVIKYTNTDCDIRYFGGKHQRALVKKEFVKHLGTPRVKLQLKKSTSLQKSIEQMELHQKLLDSPSALAAFIAASKSTTTSKESPNMSKTPKTLEKTSSIRKLKEDRQSPEIGTVVSDIGSDVTSRKKSKKGDMVETKMPIFFDKLPSKKKKKLLISAKNDRKSPEIGTAVSEIPSRRRSTRLTKDLTVPPEPLLSLDNFTKKRKMASIKRDLTVLLEPLLSLDNFTKKRKMVSMKRDVIPTEIGQIVSDVSTQMHVTSKKGLDSPEVDSALDVAPVEKKRKKSQRGEEPKEATPAVIDITVERRRKKHKRGKDKTKVRLENQAKSVPVMIDQSQDTVCISDSEDNVYTFSGNLTQSAMAYSENYEQLEQVTSSTQFINQESTVQSQEMQPLEHPLSDEVEMMRRKLEGLENKMDIIKCATLCMQQEVNRLTEKHNSHLRQLFDSHNAQISDTKKKQWCFFCEQDAIYHCCWNTAYCSTTCQQQHWHEEHKLVCRRKKMNNAL